jgi:hypothetical protein
MMTYRQSTGELSNEGGLIATGYSGHGEGLNNPALQNVPNVGPVPRGNYTLGPPHDPVDHLGPVAMPLNPAADNQMFGRFGFFMHGDDAAMDHSASDGCIIMPHNIRVLVAGFIDRRLVVVE